MKVYLCGPINGCPDEECKNWRESAKTVLPDTLDPMRRDCRGREIECAAEIVEGDNADIAECDALLVNYVKPSVGTNMQILFAWQLNITVIVVCALETVISPWLVYHSTQIVHSFEEALTILNRQDP